MRNFPVDEQSIDFLITNHYYVRTIEHNTVRFDLWNNHVLKFNFDEQIAARPLVQ